MVNSILSLLTAGGSRHELQAALQRFSEHVEYDSPLFYCRGRGRLLRAMEALGSLFMRVEAFPKLVGLTTALEAGHRMPAWPRLTC